MIHSILESGKCCGKRESTLTGRGSAGVGAVHSFTERYGWASLRLEGGRVFQAPQTAVAEALRCKCVLWARNSEVVKVAVGRSWRRGL